MMLEFDLARVRQVWGSETVFLVSFPIEETLHIGSRSRGGRTREWTWQSESEKTPVVLLFCFVFILLYSGLAAWMAPSSLEEGLVASTGCFAGELGRELLSHRGRCARRWGQPLERWSTRVPPSLSLP